VSDVNDLRAALGFPPVAFPGVRAQPPNTPAGTPSSAPMLPMSTQAQRALGCVGCSGAVGLGVGDLTSWYSRIPMWLKISVGVLGLVGIGYGVYRFVR